MPRTALLVLGATPDFSRFRSFCEKYPRTPEICDHAIRTIRITLTDPPPTADARIRAGLAMAPLSLILNADGLKEVRNPVFLYAGAEDPVLIPAENAKRISKLLPNLYRWFWCIGGQLITSGLVVEPANDQTDHA